MRYRDMEHPKNLSDDALAERVKNWGGALEHEYGNYSTKAAPDLKEAARRLAESDRERLLKAVENVITAATESSRATYEVAGGPFDELVDALSRARGETK